MENENKSRQRKTGEAVGFVIGAFYVSLPAYFIEYGFRKYILEEQEKDAERKALSRMDVIMEGSTKIGGELGEMIINPLISSIVLGSIGDLPKNSKS